MNVDWRAASGQELNDVIEHFQGVLSILASGQVGARTLHPPNHSNRPLVKGSIGTKHDSSRKLTLRLFFDPLEGS